MKCTKSSEPSGDFLLINLQLIHSRVVGHVCLHLCFNNFPKQQTLKLEHPSMDIHKEGKYLMLAVQELVSGDQCEGRFVFGHDSKKTRESGGKHRFSRDGTNPKSLIQTLLMRAGHTPPEYYTKHLKTNEFRDLVEFKGMQFVGKPKKNKVLAEKDAAIEALCMVNPNIRE